MSSIATLTAIPAPVPEPTTRVPQEQRTYTVHAQLVGAKVEADSDFHLVIQDGADTMIAELFDPSCAQGSKVLAQASQARADFIKRFGVPSSQRFTPLQGTVDITGVFFFDRIHGQRGVAPNGAELHPVIGLK